MTKTHFLLFLILISLNFVFIQGVYRLPQLKMIIKKIFKMLTIQSMQTLKIFVYFQTYLQASFIQNGTVETNFLLQRSRL